MIARAAGMPANAANRLAGEVVAAAVAEMYHWEGTAGADQLAPDLTRTRALLGVVPTPLADWAQRALGPQDAASAA